LALIISDSCQFSLALLNWRLAASSKFVESSVSQRLLAELADSAAMRDCFGFFVREKQWINERHLQLSRIPAPTFFEAKRAEWMLAELRALGCNAQLDRAGNVVAHPFESHAENREGPYIALTAHLDTVLAPRKDDEIHFDPDGRLLGPGVSDNGAGLVALLAIARVLRSCAALDQNLWAPLVLIANVGEEGEGNLSGMRYLCRQSPTGAKVRSFLILDGPSTDHITALALASRRFEISISGPGGHSWSDYGLVNPVHAISRAIVNFNELRLPGNASPRSSYNFGLIEGGSSINSIPTGARAKVDIRSESVAKLDELAAHLTTSVERAVDDENERASTGRLTAKIKEIGSRPGGRLSEDAPILHYIRAVDTFLGIRAHIDCASTDANIPLSLGLSAISIGVGGKGGGAHTPQEWFHPEGRATGLKRILFTLLLLLRDLAGEAVLP
jgi:tripeptide aminopeptidase